MHDRVADSVPAPKSSLIEAPGLAEALRSSLRGEVRFDNGSRALYASDGSNYRQIPIGLVVPRDADDVVATVATCRKFGAPVLPRGAGTSLAGQGCNTAVLIDFSKYPIGRRVVLQNSSNKNNRDYANTRATITPSRPWPSSSTRSSAGAAGGSSRSAPPNQRAALDRKSVV